MGANQILLSVASTKDLGQIETNKTVWNPPIATHGYNLLKWKLGTVVQSN